MAHQQWSLDDNSMFRGTTNGADLDGFCLSVKVPDNNPGSDIVLGGCNGVANQDDLPSADRGRRRHGLGGRPVNW